MHLRVVINWVPYEAGTEAHQRQLYAYQEILRLAPDWCEPVLAILPGEKYPDERRGRVFTLPRKAHGEYTGGKTLPYLPDLLDLAETGLSDCDLAGFLNSDIVVTPDFFYAIQSRLGDSQVMLVHRTDIKTPEMPPEEGIKVNRQRCTDGMFVRPEFWKEHRELWPDFILGVPWWDTFSLWLVDHLKIPTLRLRDHECLHIEHGRRWGYHQPGSIYNNCLSREGVKKVNSLHGQDKNREEPYDPLIKGGG